MQAKLDEKIHMINEELIEQVRRGLLLAPSRTYAEQYIEPFIRSQYNLLEPTADDHDALDYDDNPYEIKASKVLVETNETGTLIERIRRQNQVNEVERAILFENCESSEYLANIQNVKRDHFQTLIYVLLFSDTVKVFSVPSEEIRADAFPNWSGRHGRYDAPEKSGQFGISRRNIKIHLDRYLLDSFSYADLTEVYAKLSAHNDN